MTLNDLLSDKINYVEVLDNTIYNTIYYINHKIQHRQLNLEKCLTSRADYTV